MDISKLYTELEVLKSEILIANKILEQLNIKVDKIYNLLIAEENIFNEKQKTVSLKKFEPINKTENENSNQEKRKIIEDELTAKKKYDFFMASPNLDGLFEDEGFSEKEIMGESIFGFTFSNSKKNKATFEYILKTRNIDRILGLHKRYIAPVCEEKNNYKGNAKYILIIKYGKAEKINTGWQTVEKMEIEYMSSV
jgi:hypothetical protein